MNDALRTFKRIYPEFSSYIKETIDENTYIIAADFPDGTWYFKVNSCSVSTGYTNIEDARRD